MADPQTWASPGHGASDSVPPAPSPEAEEPAEAQTEIPLRPLSVSELLDGAITYVRRNPRPALGLSLILTCAVQVLITLAQYFVIGAQARKEVTPDTVSRSVGSLFLTALGSELLTLYVVALLGGLLAPVMARTLAAGTASGRPLTMGRAWRDVRPSAARLLGAATLLMVIGAVATGLPLVPLVLTVALNGPVGLAALLAVMGVFAGMVIAATVYVWFSLTTPALVLERRGAFAAMRRSTRLLRGRWWRAFGTLLLAQVITLVIGGIVLPAPFSIAQNIILSTNDHPTGWALIGLLALGALGRIIAGTLLNPFNAGVIALLYADMRMRREAFDLELRMNRPAEPLPAWLPGPLTAAASVRQPKAPRRAPIAVMPAPMPPRPPGGYR